MPTQTGSFNLGAAKSAASEASNYITEIDSGDGIKVHALNNPTANYAKINSDGLEVIKNGSSVAAFGVETRIGQSGGSRVEMSSNTIALVTDNGNTALKSATSAVEITGVVTIQEFNTELTGGTGNVFTLDLSSTSKNPFIVTVESWMEYTLNDGTNTTSYSKWFSGRGYSAQLQKNASSSVSCSVGMATSMTPNPQLGDDVVIVGESSKSFTVAYNSSTSKLTITTPTYPTIANSQGTYGSKTVRLTNGRSYLKFTVVKGYRSSYIPQTEISGRFYLELKCEEEGYDTYDRWLYQMLNSKGWLNECTITV